MGGGLVPYPRVSCFPRANPGWLAGRLGLGFRGRHSSRVEVDDRSVEALISIVSGYLILKTSD